MATGDPTVFTALTGSLTDPSGRSIPVNGNVAALTFAGMSTNDASATATFNPALVVITVHDPGYVNGVLTTNAVTRTIYGTNRVRWPYPPLWVSGTVYAAKRWVSNGSASASNIYYTAAGTTGATLPTHSSGTVNGWTYVDKNTPAGYFDAASGSDAVLYFWLSEPIYAGTVIDNVSVGSGAYQTTGPSGFSIVSAAVATVTNSSTLGYPWPAVHIMTPPHTRSGGSYTLELKADHPYGVDRIAATAWNMARTTSGATVTANTTSLSAITGTTSPGGGALEVYSLTVATTAVADGDAFIEYQVYPKLGTRIFDSRFDGEGADWQARVYSLANGDGLNAVIRSGVNFYSLTTYGGGAAANAPTHTSGAVTGADGYGWTWLGNDSTKASANAPARHHINNDVAGLYKRGFAVVDPSGTATGVTGVFSTSAAAAAAAGTLASCYATEFAAATALQTYNNTAGGGLTTHNDPGGSTIYLKDGLTYSGFGTSLQTLGVGSEWLYTLPLPGWTTLPVRAVGTIKACHKRHWIGAFSGAATGTSTANILIDTGGDNVSTLGQPGSEVYWENAVWAGFDTGQPPLRTGLAWIRNSTFTVSLTFGAVNSVRHQIADFSGNKLTTTTTGAVNLWVSRMFNNRMTGSTMIADPRTASIPTPMFVWGEANFLTGLTTGVCVATLLGGATGRVNPSRWAIWHTNIIEVIAPSGADKCIQFAADGSVADVVGATFRNNTHVGARSNMAYDDLNSSAYLRTLFFINNNVLFVRNTVTDTYFHTTTRDGLRTGNWAMLNMVGSDRNVTFFGSQVAALIGPNSASCERDGFFSKFGLNPTAAGEFVLDASSTGTAAGGGNYHPAPTASTLSMAGIQTRRYARDGSVRRTDGTGAIGAYESAAAAAAFAFRRSGFVGGGVRVGL